MNVEQIARAGGTMSETTAAITQAGIQALHRADSANPGAAVIIAMGAVTGALQVLAAVVGRSDGQLTSAQSVTDDSVLFAALLTVCSQNVKHHPTNPDIVAVCIDHGPDSFLHAMDMFQKLTGRSAEPAIEQDFVNQARKSAEPGNDLLNKVCANRKPA